MLSDSPREVNTKTGTVLCLYDIQLHSVKREVQRVIVAMRSLMERVLRKHLKNGRFENVDIQRSRLMSSVKGTSNKTTERRLRAALAQAKIVGWRLHPPSVVGRPDFFFSGDRLAVFVDGCFWHACSRCGHFPRSNSAYWRAKLHRTRQRDRKTTQSLVAEGYRVLRFWEHEVQHDLQMCVRQIGSVLRKTN